MHTEYRNRYRSLFWPIVLIGVGCIWLMANLGYINAANLVELWRFWPVLLIAVGVDILIGRQFPLIGVLLGLAVVALAGFILVRGVQLPGASASTPAVITEHLTLPVESASQARVSLNFWSDPVNLYALQGSDQLLDATITHSGRVDLTSSGSAEKTVRLSHAATFDTPFFLIGPANRRADIGLTSGIPLELTIDGGSGSLNLDLNRLMLTALNLDSGSGSVTLTLAQSAKSYPVRLDTGSGSVQVNIPQGTSAEVRLDAGSGSVSISVPQDAGLRIDVQDSGSGSLSLPPALTQTRQGTRKQGTWETANFSSAAHQITLLLANLGSGSVSISR